MERTAVINVSGLSGLLCHNPANMKLGGEMGKGKKIPTPEAEAVAGCYTNAEGLYCVPQIGIRNSIVKAARSYKIGKLSAGTVLAHMRPGGDLVVITNGNSKPAKKYVIDTRRVVIKGHGAVLRSRPLFMPWSAEFLVLFDDELVEPTQLEPIVRDAGNRVGIGDYRPEKGGWFGRFKVEQFRVV